jgi:hypothetical protein
MNQGRKETGYLKDKERKGWIVVLRDNARDQSGMEQMSPGTKRNM